MKINDLLSTVKAHLLFKFMISDLIICYANFERNVPKVVIINFPQIYVLEHNDNVCVTDVILCSRSNHNFLKRLDTTINIYRVCSTDEMLHNDTKKADSKFTNILLNQS